MWKEHQRHGWGTEFHQNGKILYKGEWDKDVKKNLMFFYEGALKIVDKD
jgi:hypothetical protein